MSWSGGFFFFFLSKTGLLEGWVGARLIFYQNRKKNGKLELNGLASSTQARTTPGSSNNDKILWAWGSPTGQEMLSIGCWYWRQSLLDWNCRSEWRTCNNRHRLEHSFFTSMIVLSNKPRMSDLPKCFPKAFFAVDGQRKECWWSCHYCKKNETRKNKKQKPVVLAHQYEWLLSRERRKKVEKKDTRQWGLSRRKEERERQALTKGVKRRE